MSKKDLLVSGYSALLQNIEVSGKDYWGDPEFHAEKVYYMLHPTKIGKKVNKKSKGWAKSLVIACHFSLLMCFEHDIIKSLSSQDSDYRKGKWKMIHHHLDYLLTEYNDSLRKK